VFVDAHRVGYKNPVIVVDSFDVPQHSIAVVDDVVSSGDTAVKVFEKIKRPITLATWVLQYPRDLRLAVYESIYASVCVCGEKGKVPVNSILTFLQKPEVAQSYAMRFCKNPDDFFVSLELIREEVSRS
jgi:hypoxanthine phosphoribosyltransferase